MLWPREPAILELNVWTWLDSLRRRHGRALGLGDVPAEEWDRLVAPGFDGIWLMGVWERSAASQAIAREHPNLQEEYRKALADFSAEDVVGSPYAVRRYVVDERLGGDEGLAMARRRLSQRGVRLVLDFVPNHVAVDHPWVTERPELFISRTGGGEGFFASGGNLIAHGKDPNFPPWTDTAQLHLMKRETRSALTETLCSIADKCDGVRCDMAMLPMVQVFERTWGELAAGDTTTRFWPEVLGRIRGMYPGFLFMGEVYWNLEGELLAQGFDLAYDKRLRDRLLYGDGPSVREHVEGSAGIGSLLVRFLENHDESRAAGAFARPRHKAAAVAAATLPGAWLVHEGEAQGLRVRLPVQLGRRPAEAPDAEVQRFYDFLFRETLRGPFRRGQWESCRTTGWPDNQSHRRLLTWARAQEHVRTLVVVNLAPFSSQARVVLPWADLAHRTWRLFDVGRGVVYERSGDEMLDPGLFVDLEPWGFHMLSWQ
ncbi:MAG: alpha-amylase [Deltaproteobacteria bacterium]|nr:alpha-amylase [Deltaproteobacteria bacterium]